MRSVGTHCERENLGTGYKIDSSNVQSELEDVGKIKVGDGNVFDCRNTRERRTGRGTGTIHGFLLHSKREQGDDVWREGSSGEGLSRALDGVVTTNGSSKDSSIKTNSQDGAHGGRQPAEKEETVNLGSDSGGREQSKGEGSWGKSGVEWAGVVILQ